MTSRARIAARALKQRFATRTHTGKCQPTKEGLIRLQQEIRSLALDPNAPRTSVTALVRWIDRKLELPGCHEAIVRRVLRQMDGKDGFVLPKPTGSGGRREKVPEEKSSAVVAYWSAHPRATAKETAALFQISVPTLNKYWHKLKKR